MLIKNEDIKEVVAEIPDGHKHVRMTIRLQDGQELTFLEASVASIVRAYITVNPSCEDADTISRPEDRGRQRRIRQLAAYRE